MLLMAALSLATQTPARAPSYAPAASGPSTVWPSILEPLQGAAPSSGALAPEEGDFTITPPSVVFTETPESAWLASGQSAYLEMLGDHGAALAGFYDPFSFQFAYGDVGAQPYRLGWYSYNDYLLMTNSPTSIGGNFQDQQWNAWMRYAWLLRNSTVLTWTAWMNGKFWTGPSGLNLPPGAAQFISDFQWASANASN